MNTLGYDKLKSLIAAAEVLANSVLHNCDDWSEGRAYAHSVLRWKDRYEAEINGAQELAIPNVPVPRG